MKYIVTMEKEFHLHESGTVKLIKKERKYLKLYIINYISKQKIFSIYMLLPIYVI